MNLVSLSVTLILLCGILWFERFGSDAKRTIFNKLVSLMSWNAIFWIVAAQMPDLKRHIFGPMSKPYCHIHQFIKNSLSIHLNLVVTSIVVIRHLFIFKLKNPYRFCDDFWTRFINIWIVAFAISSQIVYEIQNDRESLSFYWCTGIQPKTNGTRNLNLAFYGSTILSLTAQALIQIRVLGYKWMARKRISTDQSLVTHHVNQSLAEHSALGLHTIFSVLFAILFRISSQIEPTQFNNYPNYLYVYAIQLYLPSLCYIILTSTLYFRHKNYRQPLQQS